MIIGAGIGLGGPSHPNPVQASSHVVRSLSDQTVQPGGRLTVTITASQYGDYAELIETLPEGFSFVSSDQPANVLVITESGRQIRIILLGPSRTVSYSMNASHVVGRHTISGLFRDEAKLESTVAGDDTVEVLGEAVAETGPSDSVADDVADGEGNGEGDTRGEDDAETEDEGHVETGGEDGEAELGELEEGEQGDSDMTDGTDGELSAGDVTEEDEVQGEDGDAEDDEDSAVVWTTAGTGGRADISRGPGSPDSALGAAAGEEFPLWLMLLVAVGGAIEVALIITVLRTRMWLALRV